jgi:hypothetical protein
VANVGGRVHIYYGGADKLQPSAMGRAFTIDNPDGTNASFGASVASGGDVDGNGYGDVIVGAPYTADGTIELVGVAHLYLGGSDGLQPGKADRAQLIKTADGYHARFGSAVAFAGDIDGDGLTDAIIGAPRPDGDVVTGHAHFYLGNANGQLVAQYVTSGFAQDGVYSLNYGGAVAGLAISMATATTTSPSASLEQPSTPSAEMVVPGSLLEGRAVSPQPPWVAFSR